MLNWAGVVQPRRWKLGGDGILHVRYENTREQIAGKIRSGRSRNEDYRKAVLPRPSRRTALRVTMSLFCARF